MAILSSMVTALSGFNPDGDSQDPDVIDENIASLLQRLKLLQPIHIENLMVCHLYTPIII